MSGFPCLSPPLQKKAVLLSGPPGVGKTTCAVLVAKSLGFGPIIEVNASDARGKSDGDRKKGLNGKGSNQIRELLNNRAMGKVRFPPSTSILLQS